MLSNGVRVAAANSSAGLVGGTERVHGMTVSLRESLHQVADPQNLDASVEEVFELMLGLECRHESGSGEREADSVTAVVGFGGLLSGACVLSSGRTAALEIAAHM